MGAGKIIKIFTPQLPVVTNLGWMGCYYKTIIWGGSRPVLVSFDGQENVNSAPSGELNFVTFSHKQLFDGHRRHKE